MKPIYLLFALGMVTSCAAQSPVKETLAYSRETIPGIPGKSGATSSQNPISTSFFIYVVIKKGATVSLAGVCVNGKSYLATWKRVESPVLIEHDASVPTGQKDTLVKKTSDDVYQLELGQQKSAECNAQGEENLAQRNDVVVFLKSGQSSWHGLADKLVPLHPAAAM